ncbi:MAG: cyclic nucleotide-binding domain-containing protein [Ignavibacteria bacterium]|nr:cyclic nucleotide-binding domain-containing protein [Ignavibacteria bacterium]
METLKIILAEHPFFKDFEAKHLDLIAGCASNVKFNPEKFLFREGEEANKFYLIRSGKVAVEMYGTERGSITIQTIGRGEILGWSWLIPPYLWHFDAHAIELTRAIALDGKCLRKKCEKDSTLGYKLMKRIAYIMENRLQATRLQLLDMYAATE